MNRWFRLSIWLSVIVFGFPNQLLAQATSLTLAVDFSTIEGGIQQAPSFANGRIAFSTYGVYGVPGWRVYLWDHGVLSTIVDPSTPVPGGSGTFTVGSDYFSGAAVDKKGNVAFLVNGPHGGVYFYNYSTQSLSAIVNTNTLLPGTSATFSVFNDHIAHLDDGHIVFRGSGGTARDGATGVFTNVNGPLEAVAIEKFEGGSFSGGTLIPGTLTFMTNFGSSPRIDGHRIFFVAWNGTGFPFVWDADTGVISTVFAPAPQVLFEGGLALEGDTVAGYGNFSHPIGVTSATIYRVEQGMVRIVADADTPVPGGSGTFEAFDSFEAASLDGGRLAFGGGNWSPQGFVSAIFLESGGVLERVIGMGTTLSGHTITDIGYFNGMGGLSDRSLSGNQLAFRGQSTDSANVNHSGIYIVNLAAPLAASAGADQTVPEGTAVTLDGTASSGSSLTFAWTQAGGPPVLLNGSDTASPTFQAPEVDPSGAVLTFELTVSDGHGAIAGPDSVVVSVTNVNQAPHADAGADQVVDSASSVTLSGAGSSDPDGDTLEFSWTQTSGPAVALTAADSSSTSFTAPVVAENTALLFVVTVSDGHTTASDVVEISVHTTASAIPDTTITAPLPAGVTRIRQATFTFASESANVTFTCSLDAAAFAACVSPRVYRSLGVGPHLFAVRATNAAGADPSPATFAWTIDRSSPETTIATDVPAVTKATIASFAFSSNEANSSFECRLDTAAFAPCASPVAFTSLADGHHAFRVRAIDAAGNVDRSAAVQSWVVDTVPPVTRLTSHRPARTNTGSAAFGFAANQKDSVFKCRIDQGPATTCVSPVSYTSLTEGDHSFIVEATDPAGNTDTTPASFAWFVDTVPPDTSITSAPASLTNSASAKFAFGSDEIGVVFQCSLDGLAFTRCGGQPTFGKLLDGTHQLLVRAEDSVSNLDPTPAIYTWRVDRVSPILTILSGPVPSTTDTSAAFTFGSDEGGSTFECRLDGGPFETCPSPMQYSNLGKGTHNFRVRAIDDAGNSSTTVLYSWVVRR